MHMFWNEGIERRVLAGLDSIVYRQSLSGNGSIVESDPRVDRGNYLYADRCWPRNYHIEALLKLDRCDLAIANLQYWKTVFEHAQDSFFRHNYHFKTAAALSDHQQIDNNAHIMLNISYLFDATDLNTVEPFMPMLESCGAYLVSCLDEDINLLRGREERVVEGIAFPECYSFYINRICACALERAASIAQKPQWQATAALLRSSIRSHLWDAERKQYAYLMFTADAEHEHAGQLSFDESWGILWPYIHDTEYEAYDKLSVRARINALWKVDPLLPEFICQKEPATIEKLLETGDDKPAFQYSGVGVCPAANAVAALILAEKEGDLETALQLWQPLEQCPADCDLIPEHINTMHPGRMKDYSLWPDAHALVDSGNLMHLSMFMTAALRLRELSVPS